MAVFDVLFNFFSLIAAALGGAVVLFLAGAIYVHQAPALGYFCVGLSGLMVSGSLAFLAVEVFGSENE